MSLAVIKLIMFILLWQEESGNITAAIPVIKKDQIQRKRDKGEKKHHGKEVFKQKGTDVSVDNVVCTSGGGHSRSRQLARQN